MMHVHAASAFQVTLVGTLYTRHGHLGRWQVREIKKISYTAHGTALVFLHTNARARTGPGTPCVILPRGL